MSSEAKVHIPPDITSYLDEIAERLWSSHAAVMIGAGFSKNARKAIATAPSFPNWHELGNRFYEKLHNRVPDGSTHHYLNPLNLADEVQAAFGRPALDQAMRTHIPDKEYEPSELHVRLLELPWVDVFTVNYDTLLERASNKVVSRRFDVVVNKEDLVYSSRPRIVKLHGSFPSSRPFVVSEEDYRRYPKEQAPFVNTVQQTLLENTLCLIGFSGDDPNFLHWIGWVRDNLGKDNAPKIYLVGILSLSTAQRKLLEDRNVVLVDMGRCPGAQDDHQKALALFFDHLRSRKPVVPLDWTPATPPDPQTIEECLRVWKADRQAYPNWIVAPESSRESLLLRLRMDEYGLSFPASAQSIAAPSDIAFLYELNWRLERALCPIPNDLLPHYERILGRYNPYPRTLAIEATEFNPEQKQFDVIDWKTIGSWWLELSLSLLRFYREEGMSERWTEVSARLASVKDYMSPEQIARLSHERSLNALFAFDFAELKKELAAWPVNSALPFWEAKRAGIFAELGETAEAGSILEEALAAIRSNQQLTPVVTDFTWVSQEGHAMYLLSAVNLAMEFPEYTQTKENSERWNELKKYRCDPWNDLKIFGVRLEAPPASRELVTRKRGFDIDRETVTHHLGGDDSILLGYAFLRYCEEVGLPFVLSSVDVAKKQAGHAAERIASFSSAWAMATLLRLGEAKMADSLFDRNALARMSVENIDGLVDRFVEMLRKGQPTIAAGNRFSGPNLGVRIASVIPEILSRLCAKCSPSRSQKIFEVLKELYRSQVRLNYSETKNLTKRLLDSWSKAEQCARLHELFEFPLVGDDRPLEELEYPEPFLFLAIDRDDVQRCSVPPIPKPMIESLLVKVTSGKPEERFRASARLAHLYDWGLLNEDQAASFGAALWTKVGQDGFPLNKFHKWLYLKLPGPVGIDVVERFKRYVMEASFTSIDTGSGIKITGGEIPLCVDILRATTGKDGKGLVDWSAEETVALLDKLIVWWDAGKSHLRAAPSPFWDIAEEFRARYKNLIRILASAVAPRLAAQRSSDFKDRLKRLLDELDEHGLCALPARAACIPVLPDEQERVLSGINSAMTEGNPDRVMFALEAVRVLSTLESMGTNSEMQHLLSITAQQIKWRRELSLVRAMMFMNTFTIEAPGRLIPDVVNDVLSGLGVLRQESHALARTPNADISTRLSWRRHAARLAFSFYQRFLRMGAAMPPVILEWQRICSDPEEFAEVRNQWGG